MANNKQLVEFGMIPAASSLTGFVLAVLLSLLMVQAGNSSDHSLKLSNAHADKLQQQLNIKLSQIVLQSSRMANSVQLAQIVSDMDLSSRFFEEANLTAVIPHAIRVRIFGLREAVVDRDEIPPFSFTSLDLVNRAEQGEIVNPEAINNNGRWIISIATPIRGPSEERVRGTLFIYLDMQSMMGGLEANVLGSLKLMQTVGSAAPVEISRVGSDGAADTSPIIRPLDNTKWAISFVPSIALISAGVGSLFGSLLAPILFLLISLAGVFVGITKGIKIIRADLGHLEHQIPSVASGSFEADDQTSMNNIKDICSRYSKTLTSNNWHQA
ncbi:MAG: hypothetical protein VB957_14680 [Pseudomonadales bacterium]